MIGKVTTKDNKKCSHFLRNNVKCHISNTFKIQLKVNMLFKYDISIFTKLKKLCKIKFTSFHISMLHLYS